MVPGKILLFLSLLPMLTGTARQPAEMSYSFQQVVVDYLFGEHVTFEARLGPASRLPAIQAINLLVAPPGVAPVVVPVQVVADGLIRHTYDLASQEWPAFSTVLFKFQVTAQDGTKEESETFSFLYDDNRLEWKSLSSPPFLVYWHDADTLLGQTLLQTALSGLQSARAYSSAMPGGPVRIYAYSDPDYLRTALHQADLDLMAAHAAPERGVILLSAVPGPGLQLELERQVPHEISHILVYALSGAGFSAQPIWLVEGIATLSELYPNADYQRVLNTAIAEDALLSMESLCSSFPTDPSQAFLAYAQSASFVNFLYKRYGAGGLDLLTHTYANGLSCTSGVEAAFGETFQELVYRWQQEALGIDSGSLVLRNLAPYLVIFLALGLSPILPFIRRKRTNSSDPPR